MSFIEPIYESEKEDNHMRLEIGNFYVKDIKFGDKLSFDDGVLTINKKKHLILSVKMRESRRQIFILQNLEIRSVCVR